MDPLILLPYAVGEIKKGGDNRRVGGLSNQGLFYHFGLEERKFLSSRQVS
jgi:hypothetical protein